jgi:hypothetical protein
MSKIPILTYHSHRVLGGTYETNDHIALYHDLRAVHAHKFKVIPLHSIVEWFLGTRDEIPQNCIAITFDDGCDLDWVDYNHPQHGLIRSFSAILSKFQNEVGDHQPDVQASSFVIGSPVARRLINHASFPGLDLLNDYWWKFAEASGILKIYNHSWDHNHPAVDIVCQKDGVKGSFENIDTFQESQCEVAQAALFICERIFPGVPDLFAFPYGPSSDYIRGIYFPHFIEYHRTLAAFGASGGYLVKDSPRWDLPRFVSGAPLPVGWRTKDELIEILDGAR